MNIVKTLKKILFKKKKKNLDIILNEIIDDIEIKKDGIYISTKQNIALINKGHFIHINSGSHVIVGKEIHLNPEIDFNKEDGFKELQEKLDTSKHI